MPRNKMEFTSVTNGNKSKHGRGGLRLGYGSEFHLLRWLGRHRDKLTELVCDKRKEWHSIRWLDFNFSAREKIPDQELQGIEFLNTEDNKDRNYYRVLEAFSNSQEKSWPSRGEKMNWDLVGVADDGTYILCEAKAHTEEIKKHKKTPKSARKINQAFELPKKMFEVDSNVDWLHTYYQMANRLYMVALLESCGIKSVLLNILFTGDCFPDGQKVTCPKDQKGWSTILDDEYGCLGLDKTKKVVRDHVIELFLPVCE